MVRKQVGVIVDPHPQYHKHGDKQEAYQILQLQQMVKAYGLCVYSYPPKEGEKNILHTEMILSQFLIQNETADAEMI